MRSNCFADFRTAAARLQVTHFDWYADYANRLGQLARNNPTVME